MPSFIITRLKTQLVRLWRIDAPLTSTTLVMVVALAACCGGLWVDPRLISGAPVWLKPAKFAASIALYCLTLVWLFGYVPAFVRTRRIVGRVTTVAMLLEMGLIALQAARGTTSHFNVSTPLDAVCFMIMGIGIVAQTLSTVAVAIALFRQQFADHALGWATRLGMLLTIAGAFIGGAMTQPTEKQLAEMQKGQPTVSGAHTVGAPDGEPGMPVTGWSREHGDLRVPHFLGLHALQVLPLFAFGLSRTRASSTQRVRLVFTLAGSYASLVGILLQQALRGHALFAPDSSTLVALLAWLALTCASTWGALTSSASSRRAVGAASKTATAS